MDIPQWGQVGSSKLISLLHLGQRIEYLFAILLNLVIYSWESTLFELLSRIRGFRASRIESLFLSVSPEPLIPLRSRGEFLFST